MKKAELNPLIQRLLDLLERSEKAPKERNTLLTNRGDRFLFRKKLNETEKSKN